MSDKVVEKFKTKYACINEYDNVFKIVAIAKKKVCDNTIVRCWRM